MADPYNYLGPICEAQSLVAANQQPPVMTKAKRELVRYEQYEEYPFTEVKFVLGVGEVRTRG